MILGWSKHQERSLHEPTAYGLDVVVEKPIGKGRERIVRDPAPELLVGEPRLFQATAARLRLKLTYRSATFSWDNDEFDATAFNAGDPEMRRQIAAIVETADNLFHAGVPDAARLPMWVGTHTHTGRMELNFAIPRGLITPEGEVRSFNPHPPTKGSEADCDALCDTLIATFGYASPRDPERRAWLRGPGWAEKKLAEMGRGEVRATEDRPVLWLLATLKGQAEGRENIDDLLSVAKPLMKCVEFEVLRQGKKTVRLGPQSASRTEGLTLRGSLIDGGGSVFAALLYRADLARA